MHEAITESIAYEKGLNQCKVNYSKEDLIVAYTNELVMDWVKSHHPHIIEKIKEFVKKEFDEKDME